MGLYSRAEGGVGLRDAELSVEACWVIVLRWPDEGDGGPCGWRWMVDRFLREGCREAAGSSVACSPSPGDRGPCRGGLSWLAFSSFSVCPSGPRQP